MNIKCEYIVYTSPCFHFYLNIRKMLQNICAENWHVDGKASGFCTILMLYIQRKFLILLIKNVTNKQVCQANKVLLWLKDTCTDTQTDPFTSMLYSPGTACSDFSWYRNLFFWLTSKVWLCPPADFIVTVLEPSELNTLVEYRARAWRATTVSWLKEEEIKFSNDLTIYV